MVLFVFIVFSKRNVDKIYKTDGFVLLEILRAFQNKRLNNDFDRSVGVLTGGAVH